MRTFAKTNLTLNFYSVRCVIFAVTIHLKFRETFCKFIRIGPIPKTFLNIWALVMNIWNQILYFSNDCWRTGRLFSPDSFMLSEICSLSPTPRKKKEENVYILRKKSMSFCRHPPKTRLTFVRWAVVRSIICSRCSNTREVMPTDDEFMEDAP